MPRNSPLQNAIAKLTQLNWAVKEQEKSLREAKRAYAAQEAKVLERMDKEGLTHAGDKAVGRVNVTETDHYSIANYRQFELYVLRNKATELFQNRISKRALEERLEAGKKVPGVQKFTKRTLRIVRSRG